MGREIHNRLPVWRQLLFDPGVRRAEIDHRRQVEDVIDFLELAHYRDERIANLPYGVRKKIELGRALCVQPDLLLLDEPASGLNPEETEDMGFWIDDIKNDLGITVLMIEHDMSLVNEVSDRVLALNNGRAISGDARHVQESPGCGGRLFGDRRMSETAPNETMLSIRNLETFYGPVMAIRGVSLDVMQGQIVAILGSNGAGKTTVLKTISGAMEPQKGSIVYNGQDITGHEPDRVARAGIGHVPEGREVFPFLSVQENLEMGAFSRRGRTAIAEDLEMVFDYFPDLRKSAKNEAAYLSGGQQQMLAIGRALMMRPHMMLLDEPSLGLSPKLVGEIFDIIRRLNSEQQMTILLVEQNAHMALQLADFGYVLEVGRVVMEGDRQRLLDSRDIQEFYLGRKEESARGKRRWKQRKTWR